MAEPVYTCPWCGARYKHDESMAHWLACKKKPERPKRKEHHHEQVD